MTSLRLSEPCVLNVTDQHQREHDPGELVPRHPKCVVTYGAGAGGHGRRMPAARLPSSSSWSSATPVPARTRN